MPGRDGTGPRGEGPRTGWGWGRCRPEAELPETVTTEEANTVRDALPAAPGFGRGMARRHRFCGGGRFGRGGGFGRGRGGRF